MKIIDLLNKIANGEELPNKIRFDNIEWNRVYGEKNVCYIDEYDNDFFLHFFRNNLDFTLNDEVEIIEEEPRDIEVCGSWITRSEYNRLSGINEDKKIEKLDKQIDITKFANEYKEVAQCLTNFSNKINEIIDYINKGE